MRYTLWLVVVLLLSSCAGTPQGPPADPIPTQAQASSLRSGIETSGFDPAVRPQDDFYRHVNGTWLKETPLPGDRADYGAFSVVSDEAEVQLREIIKELEGKKDLQAGTAAQKIRDYYQSYLGATERAQNDMSGIQVDLDAVDAIKTHEDFYALAGRLGVEGVGMPLTVGAFSDLKDPNQYTVYLEQSGLTLPDRDYYLEDEERYVQARDLYKAYVDQVLGFGGYEPAAQRLLDFESELARIAWTREQLRDPSTQYNPKNLEGLKAASPKLGWEAFLKGAGVPAREQYVLAQVSYFEGLDDLLASTDVSVLKDYLRFKVISRYAGVLGKPAFEAHFNFYSKGLRGVQEPRPAWKRAISNINWSMGELLGQLYVKRHFKPEAKERMEGLVANLVSAYEASINELDWMGEQTRAQALEKLGTFKPKIGYPDKWKDFEDLKIGTDAVANARAISRFGFERQIKKLDLPVDKSEWGMPPQIVNAYYNPLWNEIVFPAAILQPPFFDLEADDAANYGAIGAVIGHEIGHGFDDQGRKFDSQGRLRDWWTAEDAAAFDKKKEALKAQYDAFTVLDGKPINGEFTSGENIGDLAGLSIAYRAYRMSLNGQEAPVIDGFTGDQRFFMGWAQVWRRLYTDAELARRLTVDPHSPSEARTNVIVRNIPAFYEAFGVKEGDKMYLPPEQRVRIW